MQMCDMDERPFNERVKPNSVIAFEKHFPCPRNCEYLPKYDKYSAEEPYHWGTDKEADDQNKIYKGWKAAKSDI